MQPADYADPAEGRIALKSMVERHERLAAGKVLSNQPTDLIVSAYDEVHGFPPIDGADQLFISRIRDEYESRKKAGLVS